MRFFIFSILLGLLTVGFSHLENARADQGIYAQLEQDCSTLNISEESCLKLIANHKQRMFVREVDFFETAAREFVDALEMQDRFNTKLSLDERKALACQAQLGVIADAKDRLRLSFSELENSVDLPQKTQLAFDSLMVSDQIFSDFCQNKVSFELELIPTKENLKNAVKLIALAAEMAKANLKKE